MSEDEKVEGFVLHQDMPLNMRVDIVSDMLTKFFHDADFTFIVTREQQLIHIVSTEHGPEAVNTLLKTIDKIKEQSKAH